MDFAHFQMTAIGFDKGKTKIDDAAVNKVADYGKGMIC